MSDHWKALADRLGAPGLDPSTRRSRETSRNRPEPESPPSDVSNGLIASDGSGLLASGNSKVQSPTNDVSEPPISSELMSPASGSESVEPEVAMKKKRSNWERVASLFGLASQPEPDETSLSQAPGNKSPSLELPEPTAPTESKKPSPKQRSPKSPSAPTFNVSGLFETSSEEDVNPALAEMFGQTTSAYPDTWEKPTRIIDDVGWDQPEDNWSPTSEPDMAHSSPSLDSDSTTADPGNENDGEDFPRKRSRRRRRRGGGGKRTEREPGSVLESNEDDSDADSRSSGDIDSGHTALGDLQPMRDESPESELPERRSARRRHRRSRDGSDFQPHQEDVDASLPETDSSYGNSRSESEHKSDKDDEGTFPGRRRQRRPRGGSTNNERPQVHEQPFDDFSEPNPLTDEMADDDAQHSGRAEHRTGRNIPTWDDTLSVMITANIENHRRNENRGSRGSGRSKGRR